MGKSRTQSIGYFSQHFKHAKQSLKALFHRPLGNILTISVIALSIALPATFYLLAKNINFIADQWQTPTQVTVYLDNDLSSQTENQLKQQVELWPEVNSLRYVSPDEGLNEFRTQAGFEQALFLLKDNPLPAVFIITPSVEWQDSSNAKQLVAKLADLRGVNEVRLDSDWLQRLEAIQKLVTDLAIVFGSLMVVSLFLIIGNTLRLQVLNHRDEIQVMKLVGATDNYIQRPYLYTGVWYGVLGVVIANGIILGISLVLESAVSRLASLYNNAFTLIGFTVDEALILLLLVLFISWFAAKMASSRHLKEIEPV
ncbi:permease-like cell division protein FtsX [Vibrio sp. SS-MA-C1-2]|uniref:permease-like cell division protein FtsX n=1 Tax=Vibrio sp. SS-MA-C1-2 TaxID=2908646 RepID=UPI001F169B3C|nr:permease-like cell division protein FtsX [Vibrio sp. SS-MA-C1-2]UJF19295.1 permease-like cell division protein FtsX [Vibrio sp. SS-MA-C1-2]